MLKVCELLLYVVYSNVHEEISNDPLCVLRRSLDRFRAREPRTYELEELSKVVCVRLPLLLRSVTRRSHTVGHTKLLLKQGCKLRRFASSIVEFERPRDRDRARTLAIMDVSRLKASACAAIDETTRALCKT